MTGKGKHMEKIERPEIVSAEHLEYLDELRESGTTNMFDARPYLMEEFDLESKDAQSILIYWMRSFGEIHPADSDTTVK